MKWGIVKQARQQEKRMEKRGITSNAGEKFKAAQKAIKENTAAKIERINDMPDVSKRKKATMRKEARAAENVAMERAATQFMESGFATVQGIEYLFEGLKDEYPEVLEIVVDSDTGETIEYNPQKLMEDATKGDPKLMAEYLDADEDHRKEMEARHIAGSDSIQQLADLQGAGDYSAAMFYDNLRAVAASVSSGRVKNYDELQTMIMKIDAEARRIL